MSKNFSIIAKICEVVTGYSIYIIAGLMPILFLPWTTDYFDFNKQTALIVFVFIGLFAWLIRILVSGRFKANISIVNIAVLALFVAYIASNIFSLDKNGSFWGWPRVVSESLMSVIGFTVFYFLVSSALSKKEVFKSITIFFCSSLVAFFYGLLQLLGLYIIPFGALKSTSFNTVGLVGGLGMLAAILLPLAIIMEVVSKKWVKVVYAVGIALIACLLVVVNYPIVWWAVLIGSIAIISFLIMKKDIFDQRWLALPMFFLVLSVFFVVLSPQISLPSRSIEVYLNQQSTFNIALQTLKQNPVTGSGPGTFVYDFSKFKNADFNQGELWNLRFDSGASKFLTVLATTGILGIICFLALIGATLFFGVKFLMDRNNAGGYEQSGESHSLVTVGVAAALVTRIVMFFLYGSNFTLDFVFFLLLAAFVGFYASTEKEYQLSSSSFLTLAVTFLSSLFLIFGLGLLILQGQRYIAEVNYNTGVTQFSAGNVDKGITLIENAVKMNSNTDLYLTELSQAYLAKLGMVISNKDLSDEEKSTSAQLLINNSVNAGKMATDLNPNNVSNWSIRGYVYQNLVPLKVSGMDEWALKSYDSAINLEPTNPYYPTQKGLVYMEKEDFTKAMEQFDKAIQLKSDYAAARYQIAMVYQAQGKTDQEIAALEDAKKYAPNDVGLAFQMGVLYYQKQSYKSAATEFKRAISLSPNYANALYFLGLTYSQLGQKDDAIAVIQKVADLNPDNTDLPKILENIKAGKKPLDSIGTETPSQAPISETPAEKPGTPTTTEKTTK